MEALAQSVAAVERELEPVLAGADAAAEAPPLEQARLSVALAYCVNSLFFAYMRAQGAAVEGHPVQAELEKTKKYMARVKSASASAGGGGSGGSGVSGGSGGSGTPGSPAKRARVAEEAGEEAPKTKKRASKAGKASKPAKKAKRKR